MTKRDNGLAAVFGLLLAVSLAGIVYHYLTGYPYPASPATTFELNVLNDLMELLIFLPAGLAGLWALRKGNPWGPLLIAGVALTLAYDYALLVTGWQNLWIFLWTLKLALAGTATCLVWKWLPKGPGRPTWQGRVISVYLGLSLVFFTVMMGQRLLASATGITLDMAGQGAGALDWGEPALRDAILYLCLTPLRLAAMIGLWRGTEWGAQATALSHTLGVGMAAVILFTGPLKEYLQTGAISPAMWGLSTIILIATFPGVWSLLWLARCERCPAGPVAREEYTA